MGIVGSQAVFRAGRGAGCRVPRVAVLRDLCSSKFGKEAQVCEYADLWHHVNLTRTHSGGRG